MQHNMDNAKLLIRMTAEDRQAINRMIQHKRKEFESVIEKGVVAMLNAQEEHEKLAERRAEYLNFLTQRNRQKKEQLQQVTQTTKENISNAPMAIGAAGQIALTAAATAGNALYDNAEQSRQEKEAEQRLFAAQMLYYIPQQDYDNIAKKVANILSYRYQFLIFRLAAGEEGYMKLANFFVHSMKSYAIARLREHKNDVIRALINAAIPPSTDTINYRDWPSVDFRNFRTHLSRVGTHKILKLDDVANQIIKRCGPAVRALLGGYEQYITPREGFIKSYHPYTLIGALNHALICNVDARIHAGIQPEHRPYIALDGNVKYPMILLGVGESTADLGVNFATQTTDMVLEPIHMEALRRLVPDFFDHTVSYQIQSALQPIIQAADTRYSEEKYECPWNPKREKQWHEQLQNIMLAQKKPSVMDEIETFNQSSVQRLMYQASGQHFIQTIMTDADDIYQETFTAIASLFHRNAHLEREKQKVAQKAIYSLYVAQEIIQTMHLTHIYEEKYLCTIRNLINIAHLGIYASREWAFLESFQYHMTRLNLLKIRQQLDNIQHAHQIFEIAYTSLQETIEEQPHFKMSKKFLARETQNQYRKIRQFRNQMHDQIRELDKMMDIRQSILQFELQTLPPMQSSQEAFEDCMQEINRCQTNLYQESNDYETVLHQISMVQLELHLLLLLIEDIQQKDPRNPIYFKHPLTANIQQLRLDHSQTQQQFEHLRKNPTPTWIRPRVYHHRMLELKTFLEPLLETRNALHQHLSSMAYEVQTGDEELDTSIHNFFQRAYVSMQFYFIAYFINNTVQPQDHRDLYQKTKHYYLSFKIEHAHPVDLRYHQLKTLISTLSADMNIADVRNLVQHVRKEKDAIELHIRDDIEMTATISNQAQLYYRDAELSLIEIQALQHKIDFIKENTLTRDDFIQVPNTKIPEHDEIIDFFQQKLQNILIQINKQGLSTEDCLIIENYFKTALEKFRQMLNEKSPDEEDWMIGIHFLAKTLKGLFQIELKKFKDTLTLEPLKNQLQLILSHQSSDIYERSMTQKKAMQFLIKTYQNMLSLENQKKQMNKENHGVELKAWHYMRNSLTWSARLNLTEQKWLDQKLSQQSKRSLDNNTEHKTPIRMAHSFMLHLIDEYLIIKKRDLNRLRKIEHSMNQIHLLPIDLESTVHEEGTSHESFLQKKEKFSQILKTKMVNHEKELDELISSRKVFTGHILGIFFYEWHQKSFENSPHQRQSLFSKNQKKIKISSADHENIQDTPESHYSIETLETWVETFIQKTTPNLHQSESDSGEENGPTLDFISMIAPNMKKLNSRTIKFSSSHKGLG